MISEALLTGILSNLLTETFRISLTQKDLKTEIEKAFGKALRKWAINEDVRRWKRQELQTFINSLETKEKLTSSDQELLELFYKELQNNELTYSLLIKIDLETAKKTWNAWTNKLKYYDQTHNSPSHFNIHNNSNIQIQNIYIEPDYVINNISGEVINNTNFIDDCERILEQNRIVFISGGYGVGKSIASKYLQYVLISNLDSSYKCNFTRSDK